MARKSYSSGIRRKKLTGQVFGKLTVVSFSHSDKNSARWNCRCECGKTTVVTTNGLLRADKGVRSCGCAHDIYGGLTVSHKSEYSAWLNMIARCENPKCKAFEAYGARGIKVCKRWRQSFLNFFADMGAKPSRAHSLERKNNDRGYHPANCKWGTKRDQSYNTRRNHRYSFRGRMLTITEWSAVIGIKPETIRTRIRNGWSLKKALETPCDERFRNLT